MEKEITEVYCGNGRGKTTLAIGQALRASSQGKSLHFCWFCGNISILKMAQFAVLICKARYLEYNERYHLRRRHCEECY